MRRAAGLAMVVTALGCAEDTAPARDQWLVTIGSDAPIGQFGDRLLVDVLDEAGSSCGTCQRQFGLGGEGALPLSFGVKKGASLGSVRIRAQLYRADRTGSDGLPEEVPRLDRVGRLPVADGVTAVGLPLTMACFGVHSDVPATLSCDGATGTLAAEPVLSSDDLALPVSGSWAPATPMPCPEAVPPDMVCVPGGAFLLGGHGVVVASVQLRPQPEQLVQVAPFAMDLQEVTVGQLYELRRDGLVIGAPMLHDPDPQSATHMCHYLEDDRSNDALPVNCIEHALASAACVAMGKRLPTEAEWEWAAGNGPLETTYPWGSEDLDLCDRAVVGFGRTASETGGQDTSESSECRQGGADVSGARVGGSDNDISMLGLHNLAGNLAEWVADEFEGYGAGSCWQAAASLAKEPLCHSDSFEGWSTRGGSWASVPAWARVVHRQLSTDAADDVGFRCVVAYGSSR